MKVLSHPGHKPHCNINDLIEKAQFLLSFWFQSILRCILRQHIAVLLNLYYIEKGCLASTLRNKQDGKYEKNERHEYGATSPVFLKII